MLDRRMFFAGASGIAVIAGLYWWRQPSAAAVQRSFEIQKSDAEWRRVLTPAQFDILRRRATELPNQARSIMKRARERLRARDATCRCSLLQQSSTAAPAGLAFTGRYRVRLKPKMITRFL